MNTTILENENHDIPPQDIEDNDVIHTLRTAHQTQTHLISLADQKANILIGITAVIFSILFTKSNILMNLHDWAIFPFIGFLITEIIAIVLSFLVILPKSITSTKTMKIEEASNPLFFGVFTEFMQDEYVDFLSDTLMNNQSARRILIIDFYQRGLVLKRKYALLKYAYIFTISSFVLLVFAILTNVLVH